MKSFGAILAGLAGLASAAPSSELDARANYVYGFDVSGYQPNVDFNAAYSEGARFVMIKATEGTSFTDSTFSKHYIDATNAGFIRGGYHFARPDVSGGAAQADFFLAHGGGWSADGITLPGMLDIEYNPYGATCYGLSQGAMVQWISDFVEHYKARTSQYPILYTTTDWWNTCTGGAGGFGNKCPLSLARYASSAGTVPNDWPFWSFWQYDDHTNFGGNGGDSQVFNGAYSQLQKIARGG